MSTQTMTRAQRIRAVLVDAGEPLQGHKIAMRLGITTRDFNQRVTGLVNAGVISRVKRATSGRAGYWYSLDTRQLAEARLEAALLEVRGEQKPQLQVEEHDLVGRLSFLRMLKEKTVFGDHAILNLIIADYERHQHAAWRAEDETLKKRARSGTSGAGQRGMTKSTSEGQRLEQA